ncbi:MAG: SUMF1/EgtB/PvdO family nonheme iron enzyme, partial [Leptospiraceae bacterium]|nr:SUMF1/EgtB/PvdO family nonheme iron enzyme [Leptospiraceae bacterium]
MSFQHVRYLNLILILNYCVSAAVQNPITLNSFTPSKYDFHNCETFLDGMICIQSKELNLETSRVLVNNFYIDQTPITHSEYWKCVEEKGCKKLLNANKTNEPLALDFESAYNFCKWQGKVLPTLEQLLLAKQETQIKILNTEWTNTWAEECKEDCKKVKCNKICISSNNPCSGRYPCGKLDFKFVVSTSLEKKQASVSKKSETHFARCSSSSPYLTKAPAWMIQNPINRYEILPPKPTEEQLKVFHKLKEYDVLDKKFCSKPYLSPSNCRDPVSYIKPNEARNYLFAPYIKNLGGGYVGVAADANYSYVSYARSEWVFLMDFDFVILNLHKMIRAFARESPTVKEFIEKWKPTNKQSVSILEKYYKD